MKLILITLGLLVLAPASALACQVCTMEFSYNGLRFLAVWNLLLIAWLVVSAVVYLFAERGAERPGLYATLRPAILILVLNPVVAFLLGVHLLMNFWWITVVAGRTLLWPSWLPWKEKFAGRLLPHLSRPHWRAVNGLFLALALLTVPLSYVMMPWFLGENYVRACNRVIWSDLSILADTVEADLSQGATLAGALVSAESFAVPLPLLEAATQSQGLSGVQSGYADRASEGESRFFAIAMNPLLPIYRNFVFPGRSNDGSQIQIIIDEQRSLLWSPGPLGGGGSPDEVATWFIESPDGDSAPLVLHRYDPTNGSVSVGILFEWRSLD